MQKFQIYSLKLLLFLLCVYFGRSNPYKLESDQLGVNPLKSDLNNFQSKNYFLRNKRNVNIVDENNIQNNKHIIPDEVEVIDQNSQDTGTHSVYDNVCHICAKESIVQIPVIDRKMNLKPIFTKTEIPCQDDEDMMCTNINFDLRKLPEVHIKFVEKIQITYECCPGWRNTSINCCMQPVCSQECTDGEICTGPDICECPKGKNCKKDICETMKPCDHFCHNTDSSFMCSCKPGFVLASDQRSCVADENNDALEARDIEGDDDQSTFIHRLEKMEKNIENNKKAAIDLNKKIREMFRVTDFLKAKVTVLEKQYNEISSMEKRIESNEKNMEKFMKFANVLWKNNKEIFKRNLIELAQEDDFYLDLI